MRLETTHFGVMEYDEEQVITFKHGLPGFDHLHDFLLLPETEIPFTYLQSLDETEICFIVVNPFDFCPKYEFDLSESAQAELEVKNPEELQVWSIVTLKDELEQSTMNLLAPVLVNVEKRIGKQVILHNTPYKTKESIHPRNVLAGTEAGESAC